MNELNQLTGNLVMILMVSAIDRSIGVDGASLSCSISKAGGPFVGISPTIVGRGNGWYSILLTSADTSVAGTLVLHVEASGCDPSDLVFTVLPRKSAAQLLA